MRLALLILVAASAFAQARSVTVRWLANPADTGVSGYNVYRATGACSPAPAPAAFVKRNATPVTTLVYNDANISLGTYCYYVTALGGGLESAPSGTAVAVVPPGAPTSVTITIEVAVTVNVNGVELAKRNFSETVVAGQ